MYILSIWTRILTVIKGIKQKQRVRKSFFPTHVFVQTLFLQRIFWKIALQFGKVFMKDDHGIQLTWEDVKRWGHKRAYHMHSDVIFGWVLWVWLSSWDFFLSILILFRNRLEDKIWGLHRRRFASAALPLRGRWWAAAATRRRCKPQILSSKRFRKKIKISEKSPNYQSNPQYQPKKHHYLYKN